MLAWQGDLDRETENLGQTRSDFLQEAARRRLGWPDPLAVDAALLRGRAALAGLGSFESARALLDAHKERTVALSVLDLTVYEVGNALIRGRAGASAEQAATVIEALAEVCPALRPSPEEMRLASELAQRHDLTLYDAAYAAVAQSHSAELVTLDRALLDAGLGRRPGDLTEAI